TADHNPPVEAARPQQCRIKHIRTVCSRHENDALVGFEAVHLNQQLVQSLLAFVMAAAETCAAMTSDGVNFVDEDDAGGILLALLKEVTNAAGADADKHFHEIRARDREERNVSFASNRPGQQGFASSRRADQEHALGNASAKLLKFLRLAQEFNDLASLFFGLIHAGHVFERDFLLLHGKQARPALAEG